MMTHIQGVPFIKFGFEFNGFLHTELHITILHRCAMYLQIVQNLEFKERTLFHEIKNLG